MFKDKSSKRCHAAELLVVQTVSALDLLAELVKHSFKPEGGKRHISAGAWSTFKERVSGKDDQDSR